MPVVDVGRVGVPVAGGCVGLAEVVSLGVADRRAFGVRDTGAGATEKDGLTDDGCGEASAMLSPPGRFAVAAATATPRTSASTTASTTAIGEMTGGANSSSSMASS